MQRRSKTFPGDWENAAANLLSQHPPPLPVMGGRKSLFLGSLFKLARQRYYWSPARLAHALWSFATTLPKQVEILKVLKLPAFAELVLSEPRLPFKYLTRNYLARGLSLGARASCFTHHYRYLNSRLSRSLLRRALQRDLPIVEMNKDGINYSITFGQSRREDIVQDREGELSLKLQVDGTVVFVLAFTIVPGWVVATETEDVLLVTRLQGVKGCYQQINMATKALHEVAPAALLVAALQGVAEACGIQEMAGVCATSQVNYKEELSASFKNAYDDFFAELGATRTTSNFFRSAIPLQEKSLALITNGHKARTRKKRAFKLQIACDVCHLLQRQ